MSIRKDYFLVKAGENYIHFNPHTECYIVLEGIRGSCGFESLEKANLFIDTRLVDGRWDRSVFTVETMSSDAAPGLASKNDMKALYDTVSNEKQARDELESVD